MIVYVICRHKNQNKNHNTVNPIHLNGLHSFCITCI
nr:MAG TPA: Transcription intermediary factor 1-beta [Caudoviricetes sp.]